MGLDAAQARVAQELGRSGEVIDGSVNEAELHVPWDRLNQRSRLKTPKVFEARER